MRNHSLRVLRRLLLASVFATFRAVAADGAQSPATAPPTRTGAVLYRAGGCVTCHGVDGRGVAPIVSAGDPASAVHTGAPDFTRCSFTSPEPDEDWLAVIHDGGEARARGRDMPAFHNQLSDEEIESLVHYLRAFCTNSSWPRGNLNLPRALFTEQAYPENAALLTTTIDHGADAAVGNSLLYEHRLGARQQFEVRVPINARKFDGTWEHGLGDVTLAFKQVLHHDVDHGRIVSGGTEFVLPTGTEEHGLGKGATVFEPFIIYGQLLPRHSFVQIHAAFELPSETAAVAREVLIRAAAGHRIAEGRWGRVWTPMIELLGARELATDEGAPAHWDIVPELQVTLSRRQHVTFNGGLRIPLTARDERKTELAFYVLWDWFHGSLLGGWR